MVNVTVESDYIVADFQEWWKENTESADDMTELFESWRERHDTDQEYVTSDMVTAFLRMWFGENVGGIYGEGEPFTVALCNSDHLLDNDPVFVYATTELGEFAILLGTGYWSSRSAEWFRVIGQSELAILDYARAYGRCVNGHTWDTDNGGYTMYPGDGEWSDTIRIAEAIKSTPTTNYVACPHCRKAVHFYMP